MRARTRPVRRQRRGCGGGRRWDRIGQRARPRNQIQIRGRDCYARCIGPFQMPRCQNPRQASGSIASEEEAPPPPNASPRDDYCRDIPTRLVETALFVPVEPLRRRTALNSFLFPLFRRKPITRLMFKSYSSFLPRGFFLSFSQEKRNEYSKVGKRN